MQKKKTFVVIWTMNPKWYINITQICHSLKRQRARSTFIVRFFFVSLMATVANLWFTQEIYLKVFTHLFHSFAPLYMKPQSYCFQIFLTMKLHRSKNPAIKLNEWMKKTKFIIKTYLIKKKKHIRQQINE